MRQFTTSTHVAVILSSATLCAQAAARSDEVIVIPRPREMVIAGDAVSLDGAVIVIESDHATFRAGAERLNRAIVLHDGIPLPILIRRESVPWPSRAILIGTTKGVCARFLRSLGRAGELAGKGEQAYSIHHFREDGGSYVLLSGNGPVGAYYAVITFMHLLHKEGTQLHARRADVRDWPDWTWRCLLSAEHSIWPWNGLFRRDKAAFGEKFKQWIDDLADHKINMFNGSDSFGFSGQQQVLDVARAKQFAWVGPLLRYARDRGVYAMFWTGSALAPVKGNEGNPLYKDKMQLRGNYFCWSEDKLLRERFRKVGQFMEQMGISFVTIHYPDTGNENYQNRCEKCDDRFGADRAAADANITEIMVGAIRESCPHAIATVCPHPYSPHSLRYSALEAFLRDLHRQIEPGIYLTIRECGKTHIDRWNRATENRSLFVYYENRRVVDHRDGHHSGTDKPLIESNVRFLKTFFNPGTQPILFCPWGNQPIDVLAKAEYAWNVDTPGGSDAFARPPVVYERETRIPDEMVGQVYGRIVRHLFGEEAGRAFAPFCGLPIVPIWVLQPELMVKHVARDRDDDFRSHPFGGDLVARVEEQAALARKGVEIVDAILKELVPFRNDHGRKVFAHYYKTVHLVDRSAACRLTYLKAKRALDADDVEAARQLIALGLDQVKQAEEGFKSDLERIKDWPQFWKGSAHINMGYASGSFVSMKNFDRFFAEDLRQLTRALENPALARPKRVVPNELARRLNHMPIRAVRTAEPPTLDGDLGDGCWAAARKVEPFVAVVKDEVEPAEYPEAQTEAALVYDDRSLYLAFRCEEPAGGIDSVVGSEGPRDEFSVFREDIIEIFLQPNPKVADYAHLVFNVAGRQIDMIPKKTPWGFRNMIRWNPDWTVKVKIDAERSQWTAEVRIPFASFRDKHFNVLERNPVRGDVWRTNLGRERRTMEYSASSILKSFHDQDKHRRLVFE